MCHFFNGPGLSRRLIFLYSCLECLEVFDFELELEGTVFLVQRTSSTLLAPLDLWHFFDFAVVVAGLL